MSSHTCTANLVASFIVHVEDAKTNAAICAATMTWTDGSHTVTDDCLGPPDCGCYGPREQVGTFQVTVTKTGYQQAETTIVVKGGECHVITQDVTVKLSPQ